MKATHVSTYVSMHELRLMNAICKIGQYLHMYVSNIMLNYEKGKEDNVLTFDIFIFKNGGQYRKTLQEAKKTSEKS